MKQSLSDVSVCLIYLAGMAVWGFVAGRILPYSWLDETKYPFRPLPFEKNGRIYEKIGIRKWQNKLPDMSKVFTGLMPAKKLEGDLIQKLPVMIKETCVAEVTHIFLGMAGVICPFFWKGLGVWCLTFAYVFGNLPFILVQRYNRPRQMQLLKSITQKRKTCGRKSYKREDKEREDTDFEL